MTCAYLDRDLDAYVDGELDAAALATVRLHVSACADCRMRVSHRQALSRVIRSLPYHQAPARLRGAVAAGTRRRRSMRALGALAAAAVLIVAAGTASTALFQSAARGRDATAVAEVVDSHVRSLMGDHLFDVRSTDQHTVKPWFAGKLDFSPPVVDLASIGYPLAGGRVDYLGGHAVAALVYQRRQHVINVFVAPSTAADAGVPASQSIRGFHVRRWIAGGMSVWAVSDVNEADLDQFVSALRSQ